MKTKFGFIIILMALIFSGCNNDDDAINPVNPISNGIKGNIQKGPFVTGSNVMIQLLNENFVPTGIIYSTVTNNNFGGFIIENEIDAPYVEVITDGYYFDEVNGCISDSKITLRSLSKVSSEGVTNINLLTTLSKDRIIYLVRNEKLSYDEAKAKAQNEILTIFNIPCDYSIDFNRLDISQNGDENAILLAISSILQGDLRVGVLSEMLAQFIKDVKEDGVLDDQHIYNTLLRNAEFINLSSIRFNLETRYDAIDYDATIPPFEKYAKRLMHLNVIQTYPENNGDFVSGLDKIELYFNKSIDESTITTENIVVKNSSGQLLSGQLSYNDALFMAIFEPTEEMLNDEMYTVSLTGITALDKENLGEYSFSFKTFPLQLEKGLKAYYPFSGNSDDAIGTNNASVYNGSYVSDINNIGNQAYHLQGRGSYVKIPNVINLSNSDWSYSIWTNYQSLEQNVHSLLLGFSNSCDGFGRIPLSIQNTDRTTGGELREIVVSSENGKLSVPVRGNLINTWNLFTITVNNKTCHVYQNGILVGEMSSPIKFFANSQPYYISQAPHMFHNDGPLVYMDAVIDNVRFYDRALNKKEVFELFRTKG